MSSVTPLNSLREEQQVMTSLLDVLKQEQQLLVTADIESLPAVTVKKTTLVTQMTLLSAQRHRALAKSGFAAEEAAMDAWIAASGAAQEESASLWTQLLAQTREAKELNRVNGILINRQMGHTQGALQALSPQGTAAASFYGPSGMSSTIPRSRGFMAG